MSIFFKKANFLAGFFILFFVFFLFSLFFVDKVKLQQFEGNASAKVDSSDAIALRVIPNPEHYSPAKWYTKQGFDEKPESIKVDGYEAIRVGRSVYVNAANIDAGRLYTNIYLISRNQQAEGVTEDVFNGILKNWKFNTNLSGYGECVNNDGFLGKNCLIDADCPSNQHCNSEKSEIIRDVKRLADLRDIQDFLVIYKNKQGYYPKLQAGSYLPHVSISVWPSWSKILAKKLGGDLPIDPLNKIGECGELRFNDITCWDEEKKEFAGTFIPAPSYDLVPTLGLVSCSRVYSYKTSSNGLSYEICAEMESGYVNGCSGVGAGGNVNSIDGGIIYDYSENNAPRFTQSDLRGSSGEEYSTFIEAADVNGDPLTFTVDTSGVNWLAKGWSAVPEIRIPATPNQIKIYATWAGKPGNYSLPVEVDDNRGLVNSKTQKNFVINITNQPPIVNSYNPTYPASTTNYIDYRIKAKDGPPTQILTHSLVSGTLLDGLNSSWWQDAVTAEYNYQVAGTLSNTNYIPSDKQFSYSLAVTDSFGGVSVNNFTFTILNQKPIMQPIMCETSGRTNSAYLCSTHADDPDNNVISSFSAAALPASLNINANNGIISGIFPSTGGQYNISVIAQDEFGAVSDPVFLILNSATYCGDGVVQSPNSEQRGGPNNNGYEDCEGNIGVAITAEESSRYKQYACTGNCPTAGPCNDACAFTGGWCGDGFLNGPETCDNGSDNTNVPCDPDYDSTCSYCDSACSQHNVISPKYCNNGTIDSPDEQCDTAVTDINVIKTALEARQPGITTGRTDDEIRVIYQNSCESDCSILGCLANVDYIGAGCYMGQTSPSDTTVPSCQRGKWSCDSDTLVCVNVFNDPESADYQGTDLYDFCCNGQSDVLATLNLDILGGFFGVYSCDDKCRTVGKICVGVGLRDVVTHNCVSVKHNLGPTASCGGNTSFNCQNETNITGNDCRSLYTGTSPNCLECYDSDNDGIDEPYWNNVGATYCYCY